MTETDTVRIRVLAFARLRELLGFGEKDLNVPGGMSLDELFTQLATGAPGLAALRMSTRFACNGELVDGNETVSDGDEVALLPPVGGG